MLEIFILYKNIIKIASIMNCQIRICSKTTQKQINYLRYKLKKV